MPRARKPADTTSGETLESVSESGESQSGSTDAPYVNGVAASNFADEDYPTRTAADAEPARTGKKRGPKPGTKRKPKFNPAEETAKSNLAIDKLTQGVAFIHCALAGALKIEEIAMGTDEAGALVVASLDVMKEYDLTPDPRTAAWMNLVMVGATVYGTRYMAYQTRMKFAKNQTVETTAN